MAAIAALGLTRAQLAVAGALVAVAAVSGLLVALEWTAPIDVATSVAPPPAATAASKASQPPPVFTLAPLTSFSAITDRPLFAPDRRPAPQEAGETLGSWSTLVVAGIVVTPGSRTVLIAHGKPPKLVHLQEGQAVEGWVVRAIDTDHVVVANGSEEHELRILDKHESESPARGFTPQRPSR